ncbi:MAG TPA: hypothetical protein VH593_03565, partial [Ktedonobacteraceae bacterium]
MGEDHSATASVPTILYLSREDIAQLGGTSSHIYLDAVNRALTLHAQGRTVQPLKPYLRAKGPEERHIADRIIAMPAYLESEPPALGIKWIGSNHANPTQNGLERASGVTILNDPQTNYPIAILETSLISCMRTAAVTALACRHLAKQGFTRFTCIGCGLIGRMHVLTLLEQFPAISNIYLFDVQPAAAEKL